MNKHFISYLVILGLFAMSLAGCGRSNTASDQAVNPTPAQETPADAPKSEANTSKLEISVPLTHCEENSLFFSLTLVSGFLR